MSVKVQFSCCGCDAEATAVAQGRRVPIFNGSGWCVTHKPSIEDVVPKGWVAFDPYTLVTYCPECWREIMDDDARTEAQSSEQDSVSSVVVAPDLRDEEKE